MSARTIRLDEGALDGGALGEPGLAPYRTLKRQPEHLRAGIFVAEGPTAVFLTTTNPEIDPETKSRFFVTSVDESREQTQAILMFQRRRTTAQGSPETAGPTAGGR